MFTKGSVAPCTQLLPGGIDLISMLVQMEINKGIISHTVVAFGVTSSRLAYLEYYLYSGLICHVCVIMTKFYM